MTNGFYSVASKLLMQAQDSGMQRVLDAQGQRGSWMPHK